MGFYSEGDGEALQKGSVVARCIEEEGKGSGPRSQEAAVMVHVTDSDDKPTTEVVEGIVVGV